MALMAVLRSTHHRSCRCNTGAPAAPALATSPAPSRSRQNSPLPHIASRCIVESPFAFSGDEGADVGLDGETPVSDDYAQWNNAFSGKIEKVTVDIAPSNFSDADQKAVDDGSRAAAAPAE